MRRAQKRKALADPSASISCSVASTSRVTNNGASQEYQSKEFEVKRIDRRESENDDTQSNISSQSKSLPADDDASVSSSTTTVSTTSERRHSFLASGFMPPENDGHDSPEPDPERVLRQLRVPSNVELFYRTPNPFRYRLKMKLDGAGGRDYFKILPVDIVLMIFSYLNKTDLVMAAMCCRRFRDIGYNQSLWERMDLSEKFVTDIEIHSLMDRGVRYLRLTYTKINAEHNNDNDNSPPNGQSTYSSPTDEPHQSTVLPSKLTHLDLSGSATETPDIIAGILRRCTKLEGVSLEHRRIDDVVCAALNRNKNLRYLALTMCEGLTHNGLKTILQGCRRLLELNLAWTSLDENHVAVALELMPRGLKRLNLSGIREADVLTDEDVMKLIMRCEHLTEVDLSDCPGITDRSLKAMLCDLKCLKVLSISRCYGIEPTALLLAKRLRTLNVFGNITNEGVSLLREHLRGVSVNDSCFSTIAIPTPGKDSTSIWGHRTRDLY